MDKFVITPQRAEGGGASTSKTAHPPLHPPLPAPPRQLPSSSSSSSCSYSSPSSYSSSSCSSFSHGKTKTETESHQEHVFAHTKSICSRTRHTKIQSIIRPNYPLAAPTLIMRARHRGLVDLDRPAMISRGLRHRGDTRRVLRGANYVPRALKSNNTVLCATRAHPSGRFGSDSGH